MEASGRPVWRSTAWVTAWSVIGAAVLASALFGVDRPEDVWAPLAVLAAVIALALFAALRRSARQRRAHEDRLTAWAADRAAQEERLRIARELHDLASHGLGLITVRAAAAHRGDSDEHAEALRDIERASREATAELRRMLRVLRSSEPRSSASCSSDPHSSAPSIPSDETAPLEPVDAAERLPGIIAEAEALSLAVSASLPEPRELAALSPGVRVALCAIVREALLNAARHAGRTTVEVEVAVGAEREAGVEVRDHGPAPGWTPSRGAGVGLTGLHERVALLGGSLSAGPRGSGFAVSAVLPGRPGEDRNEPKNRTAR